MLNENVSKTAKIEMRDFADTIQKKFKEVRKKNPEITGFYVCGMFTYGNDGKNITIDMMDFGTDVSTMQVVAFLEKQAGAFVKTAQMEFAMKSMERIIQHKEPEMRLLQTAYEQLHRETTHGAVTGKMIMMAVTRPPLSSLNNWNEEALAPFLKKLDLMTEEEALSAILEDITENMKEDREMITSLPKQLQIQSIIMVANNMKRDLCLDTPIEEIVQRLAMALDIKAEELK